MKLVLFDLGSTLEDRDVLLPGALQLLQDISALCDDDGDPVLLALGSDFDAPAESTTTSSKNWESVRFSNRSPRASRCPVRSGCASRRRSSSRRR